MALFEIQLEGKAVKRRMSSSGDGYQIVNF